jgi:hypothetical protein
MRPSAAITGLIVAALMLPLVAAAGEKRTRDKRAGDKRRSGPLFHLPASPHFGLVFDASKGVQRAQIFPKRLPRNELFIWQATYRKPRLSGGLARLGRYAPAWLRSFLVAGRGTIDFKEQRIEAELLPTKTGVQAVFHGPRGTRRVVSYDPWTGEVSGIGADGFPWLAPTRTGLHDLNLLITLEQLSRQAVLGDLSGVRATPGAKTPIH